MSVLHLKELQQEVNRPLQSSPSPTQASAGRVMERRAMERMMDFGMYIVANLGSSLWVKLNVLWRADEVGSLYDEVGGFAIRNQSTPHRMVVMIIMIIQMTG